MGQHSLACPKGRKPRTELEKIVCCFLGWIQGFIVHHCKYPAQSRDGMSTTPHFEHVEKVRYQGGHEEFIYLRWPSRFYVTIPFQFLYIECIHGCEPFANLNPGFFWSKLDRMSLCSTRKQNFLSDRLSTKKDVLFITGHLRQKFSPRQRDKARPKELSS